MNTTKYGPVISLLVMVAVQVGIADESENAKPRRVVQTEGAQADTFSSVLVRLKEDKDAFQELMSKVVSPQMQQIRESFQGNIKKTQSLLIKLREQPTSRSLAAQYENTLSQALSELSSYLDQFASGEDETLAALSRSVESGRQALEAFKSEASESDRQATKSAELAEKFDTELTRLAQRMAPQLASNKPLPNELDTEIQKLKTNLVLAQQRRVVSRRAAMRARRLSST